MQMLHAARRVHNIELHLLECCTGTGVILIRLCDAHFDLIYTCNSTHIRAAKQAGSHCNLRCDIISHTISNTHVVRLQQDSGEDRESVALVALGHLHLGRLQQNKMEDSVFVHTWHALLFHAATDSAQHTIPHCFATVTA